MFAPAARSSSAGPARPPWQRLPVHLTTFIGRDREIAALRELLGTTRLLTVTGPGGSGKSRLALEVASRSAEEFPDGILWLEVAPLIEAEHIPRRLLAQLGSRARGEDSVEDLLAALQRRRLLLVLDGCEPLVDACAELADTLLRGSPGLRVLATSREPLGVPGEHGWLLGGLACLPSEPEPDPHRVGRSESGRLFLERARAVDPTFDLTRENASAVAEICRRLDGVPLAIELAAGRVRTLSPAQIAGRLGDVLGVLTSSSRTTVPRHRTLRAAIQWSYDLLDERERRLLERLSVFAGSFTLEAAEAVCSGEDLPPEQVLDLLSPLVDKSLLVVDGTAGEARYRLLEAVSQFAAARLGERSEAETFRRRHSEYSAGSLPEGTQASAEGTAGSAADAAVQPADQPADGSAAELPEAPALRVRALGRLEIEVSGRPLEPGAWKHAKPKELLLYLLCHPEGRTREQLGLAFWPEASAAQVKNSFHVALHRLRKRLGRSDLVAFDGRRYRIAFELGCEFDAEGFEREMDAALREARAGRADLRTLRRTLALYRGDFLAEERVGDWHLDRYDRLRRLYVDGSLALADALAGADEHAQAADAYRRVLSMEDLNEDAHRGLMRALSRMGERARALRHYGRVVELLDREVGGSPEPATTDLYERLRRGESV